MSARITEPADTSGPAVPPPNAALSAVRVTRHGEPIDTKLPPLTACRSTCGPPDASATPADTTHPAARPASHRQRRRAAQARPPPGSAPVSFTAAPSPISPPAATQRATLCQRAEPPVAGGEHRDGGDCEHGRLRVHMGARHQFIEQQRIDRP